MSARRLWHYTREAFWQGIDADQMIRVEEYGNPDWSYSPLQGRPVVWFSTRQTWGPTATPGRDEQWITWAERQTLGPMRIEVAPATAPYSWREYRALSGIDPGFARALAGTGREQGANPLDWYVSFEPVPASRWLAVERMVRGELLVP